MAQTTVTNTATTIVDNSTGTRPLRVIVRNSSATASVFIGGVNETPTTSTGLELPQATTLAVPITVGAGDVVKAIVASGSHRVDTLLSR